MLHFRRQDRTPELRWHETGIVGGEYGPEPLINIKEFLYEVTAAFCLCIYILMVYGRITEGLSKLDRDLLNGQLISHLQLHLESDKNDAS